MQILQTVIPAQLPSQTYESWIALYPGIGALDGFEDDPDGNGLANGIESDLGIRILRRMSQRFMSGRSALGSGLTTARP